MLAFRNLLHDRVRFIVTQVGIVFSVVLVEGVADAQAHIVSFGTWARPDGARETVMAVGVERDAAMGQPWNLVAGSADDLDRPDAVIIDELYRNKLGVTHVGQLVELRDRRARVVGFTRGIRTFTTAPAVFTSLANARDFTALGANQTLYLLIKAEPGPTSPGWRKR